MPDDFERIMRNWLQQEPTTGPTVTPTVGPSIAPDTWVYPYWSRYDAAGEKER